jgi:hypothetical protein
MGRWAEVYFTNPPETREAAVLDLLHELQSGQSENKTSQPKIESRVTSRTTSAEASSARTPSVKNVTPWPGSSSSQAASPQIPSAPVVTEETAVICHSCGHENPDLHRFCGGCGAPISETIGEDSRGSAMRNGEAGAKSGAGPAYATPVDRDTADRATIDRATTVEQAGIRETGIEDIRARLDPERRKFEDSIAHPNELSLFRSFRGQDSVDDDWDEAPTRRRILLGAVLAVLIAGAVYMAWRSGQLSAQRNHDAQQAATSPESKNSTATTDKNANVGPPEAAPQAGKTAAPAAKQEEKTQSAANPVEANIRRDKTIQRVSSSSIAALPPAASSVIDNGSQELAVAERYLSGTNGQRRDAAEAAKWLWKSISKHNGEATVALADLYLKGDGVSKNCDQARVLLDTAGRKGVPGAGERLRNLPAFGCQ